MNTRKSTVVYIVPIVLLLLSACVQGSGNLITESRTVSDFDRVDLSGSGDVVITQGEVESLTIETDDNIMQYVTTEVRGRTLRLDLDSPQFKAISPTRLKFTLGVKEVVGLDISGSGTIEADSLATDRLVVDISGSGNAWLDTLKADALEIQVSGSGEVDLTGEVARQNIDITGSGEVRAGDLRSDIAEVRISGSGEATLWARESLDARISGSGSVNYYGNPSLNTSTTGSGDINSLGGR